MPRQPSSAAAAADPMATRQRPKGNMVLACEIRALSCLGVISNYRHNNSDGRSSSCGRGVQSKPQDAVANLAQGHRTNKRRGANGNQDGLKMSAARSAPDVLKRVPAGPLRRGVCLATWAPNRQQRQAWAAAPSMQGIFSIGEIVELGFQSSFGACRTLRSRAAQLRRTFPGPFPVPARSAEFRGTTPSNCLDWRPARRVFATYYIDTHTYVHTHIQWQ